MRKFVKKVSKHKSTKAPRLSCMVPDSMYMRLQPGAKVYQDESGGIFARCSTT